MFIVWQGFGFLGIAVPFVVILLINLTADQIYGEGYFSSHHMLVTIALLISAIIIWFLGKYLNNKKEDRVLLDQTTGQTVILKKKHTVFWIPLQYFSLVLVAFSSLYLIF